MSANLDVASRVPNQIASVAEIRPAITPIGDDISVVDFKAVDSVLSATDVSCGRGILSGVESPALARISSKSPYVSWKSGFSVPGEDTETVTGISIARARRFFLLFCFFSAERERSGETVGKV